MAEEIVIDDACEFCFMHDGDTGSCCATDIEDMPYNCPRKQTLSAASLIKRIEVIE